VLLKALVTVGVIIAGVLLFAATKPDIIRIQRSITINAPQAKIFPLIDDFHNWSNWAPQDTEDPTIQRTFSGPASGEGAVSDWSGSGNTGKGRMTITKSVPPDNILVMVDWTKPFQAHNLNEFVLEPQGEATKVTWTMNGTNVYMMKVMGVFVNMDRFMGKHFEIGLANLKIVAERSGGR
jgi:uncharacterized protein YndB with AHSA1/START domain